MKTDTLLSFVFYNIMTWDILLKFKVSGKWRYLITFGVSFCFCNVSIPGSNLLCKMYSRVQICFVKCVAFFWNMGQMSPQERQI